jgi:hypothetical protein
MLHSSYDGYFIGFFKGMEKSVSKYLAILVGEIEKSVFRVFVFIINFLQRLVYRIIKKQSQPDSFIIVLPQYKNKVDVFSSRFNFFLIVILKSVSLNPELTRYLKKVFKK